jgi:hypothetical protein
MRRSKLFQEKKIDKRDDFQTAAVHQKPFKILFTLGYLSKDSGQGSGETSMPFKKKGISSLSKLNMGIYNKNK